MHQNISTREETNVLAPQIHIVGAGLAGLAIAEELAMHGCSVTIFEKNRIGAGASGIAAGLVHPYLGQSGKRSLYAREALELLKSKLKSLENPPSNPFYQEIEIQKFFATSEEKQDFLAKWQENQDCKDFDEKSILLQGLYIDTMQYLILMAESLKKKGVKIVQEEITLENVQDHPTVFCIGADLSKMSSICFPSKLRKGQVIIAKKDPRIERSFTTTGYLAVDPFSDRMVLGSTYEREYQNELPDEKIALEWIYPRLASHLPPREELKLTECLSGMRISPSVGYLPKFEKKQENVWVFGGFGSRGLLYHALFAKKAAVGMLEEMRSII